MKFKLDENLGTLGKVLLAADGHDVMTVADQSLQGEADEHIYEVCRKEARVPVSGSSTRLRPILDRAEGQ